MKLIQTENRNGTPNGYFDPSTGFHYTVDGEHPFWVIARLPTGATVRLTQVFVEYDDADAELDRIAALIEGKAPAQGWVSGAPPQDGKTYVVAYDHDEMRPGVARWVDGEFEDDSGQPYGDIRYHLPTPIVLP